MSESVHYFDLVLFGALPYAAVLMFVVGCIYRYVKHPFTYSSLSSQFLENKHHFWALVPFHYGIIVVLLGHLVAFLTPRHILLWNSQPLRLYILEVSALIFGLLALIGLIGAMARRFYEAKPRKVTTRSDWVLLALLLMQVASGVHVAVVYPWGSSWFATAASPYLWSLVAFRPDIAHIASMPFSVKLHIANAFVLLAYFPFTRLVHALVAPVHYFWRKPQVVRWNWDRLRIRRVRS